MVLERVPRTLAPQPAARRTHDIPHTRAQAAACCCPLSSAAGVRQAACGTRDARAHTCHLSSTQPQVSGACHTRARATKYQGTAPCTRDAAGTRLPAPLHCTLLHSLRACTLQRPELCTHALGKSSYIICAALGLSDWEPLFWLAPV